MLQALVRFWLATKKDWIGTIGLTRAEEETGLIEKADRPEARLGYRPPEEYGDGGSKVGINRPSGRTGGREGIDGR